MSGVFNIGQLVNARGLKDWTPSGGLNGAAHEPIGEGIEVNENLDGEIIAALQKHGPCSPRDLAEHVGVDRPAVSHALNPLIKAGKVKASGATISRMISLPGQKISEGSAPAKKKPAAKKVQAKTAKSQPATATSPARTPPPESDLGIAINDQGELGLQRGELKLALDPADVSRLQRFLDCTKQFWQGA